MASEKQISANRSNSQKSTGPKTVDGKNTIRSNALKHGIFKSDMSAYEALDIGKIKEELERDLKPESVIENFILERVAIHLVKLKRLNKAEKEFIQSTLHPDIPDMTFGDTNSYHPKVGHNAIECMVNIYQRYETTEENRLYRALDKFKEIKSQK